LFFLCFEKILLQFSQFSIFHFYYIEKKAVLEIENVTFWTDYFTDGKSIFLSLDFRFFYGCKIDFFLHPGKKISSDTT